MLKIFTLWILFLTFLNARDNIPSEIRKELCTKLQDRANVSNQCSFGSTLNVNQYFFTNQDEILILFNLEDYYRKPRIYLSSQKVAVRVDKKGNWTILGGDILHEDNYVIKSDPYNGIWLYSHFWDEDTMPCLYRVEGDAIKRILLPRPVVSNTVGRKIKGICFDAMRVVLKFEFGEAPYKSGWSVSNYSEGMNPYNWKTISADYDMCMSNIVPHAWDVSEKKEEIVFRNIKTAKVIKVPKTVDDRILSYVQFGAFKSEKVAKKMEGKIAFEVYKLVGYYPYLKKVNVRGIDYYKLLIGGFSSRKRTKSILDRVQKNQNDAFIFEDF